MLFLSLSCSGHLLSFLCLVVFFLCCSHYFLLVAVNSSFMLHFSSFFFLDLEPTSYCLQNWHQLHPALLFFLDLEPTSYCFLTPPPLFRSVSGPSNVVNCSRTALSTLSSSPKTFSHQIIVNCAFDGVIDSWSFLVHFMDYTFPSLIVISTLWFTHWEGESR